ncbi:MAG: hypothetical protein KDE14_15940 [Rhodobacteraceae bacterium]|nr:hypothetical protein [Paracoccaceae bacterium]
MRFLTGLAVTVVACSLAAAAGAQEVKTLGTHGKWAAFSFQENGKPVCYIASQPSKAEGNYSRRGDILMQITHRPADNATNVVSIVAGYPYKPDSDVGIQVGGNKWSLFTVEDRAWARDMETDKAIVNAFIKGNNAVVTGTSSRGTLTTDTYSLIGFTAAYRDIGKACNVS